MDGGAEQERQLKEPQVRAGQVFARLKALLEEDDPEEQSGLFKLISWGTDSALREGWKPQNWVTHLSAIVERHLQEKAVEKGEGNTDFKALVAEFGKFAEQQLALRTVNLAGVLLRAERGQQEQKQDKEF